MKTNTQTLLKYSFWILLSAVFHSIALTNFSVPGQLYPSGVTGISRLSSDILMDYFGISIPYFYLYFCLNLILAVIVYKYIGKLFTVFSLLQITLVSVFVNIMPHFIEVNDMFLIAVFGGAINGFGVGLALSHDASSGGLDFLSIYFSNKLNKSMWNYTLALNCITITVAGILYGWSIAFYSIVFQFVSTQVQSRMHKRYTHKTINIITKYPEEVSKSIFSTTRHGITKIDAQGEYLHQDVSMLYIVINSYQLDEVISSALKADPKAFINIQDTEKVVGNYYQKPLD